MSGDHVDEAMGEMIDGRDRRIAELVAALQEARHHFITVGKLHSLDMRGPVYRIDAALRARVVELEEKMATALRHLEKGRALWNGPSHQCASVLRDALGMGEQRADPVQAWREQAQFWEDQTSTLRAQNAELVAAVVRARGWLGHTMSNAERGELYKQIDAALAAAGHKP